LRAVADKNEECVDTLGFKIFTVDIIVLFKIIEKNKI